MARGTPDDGACPVCGQPYDERVVVERGDGWSDVFAGRPHEFFTRYGRRCTSRFDEATGEQRRDDEAVLYFHEGRSGHSLL